MTYHKLRNTPKKKRTKYKKSGKANVNCHDLHDLHGLRGFDRFRRWSFCRGRGTSPAPFRGHGRGLGRCRSGRFLHRCHG